MLHLLSAWTAYQRKPVFSDRSLARALRSFQEGVFLPNLWGSTGLDASLTSRHCAHIWMTSQDLPNLWGMLGVEPDALSSPRLLSLPKRRGMLACMWRGWAVGGWSLIMAGRLVLLVVGLTCMLKLSISKLLRIPLFIWKKKDSGIKWVHVFSLLVLYDGALNAMFLLLL